MDNYNIPVKQFQNTFYSGSKLIILEQFSPDDSLRYPAVVLVHGADGLRSKILNRGYYNIAKTIAEHNYHVFLIHYLDRTGTKKINVRAIFKNFFIWTKTISDAISYIQSHPHVDGKNVGVLGFSLGASIAIVVAFQDPRVKAVLECSGSVPSWMMTVIKKMPPMLILHGENDPLIPVKEAYKLESLLKLKNIPYSMKIYPGQGHIFLGEASVDSINCMIQFLNLNLT